MCVWGGAGARVVPKTVVYTLTTKIDDDLVKHFSCSSHSYWLRLIQIMIVLLDPRNPFCPLHPSGKHVRAIPPLNLTFIYNPKNFCILHPWTCFRNEFK